jgi:hypothetical protein
MSSLFGQIAEAFSGSVVGNFKDALSGHEGGGGVAGMIAEINSVGISSVNTSNLSSVMAAIQSISDVIGSYNSIDFSKLPDSSWWGALKSKFTGDLVNNFKLAIGEDGSGIYGMIQTVNATPMQGADTSSLAAVMSAIQNVTSVMSSYNSIDFSKLPDSSWWGELKSKFTGDINSNFTLALNGIIGLVTTINSFDVPAPSDTASGVIIATSGIINNINAALVTVPGEIQQYTPLLLTQQLNNAFDGARQVIGALTNSGLTTPADPSGYINQTVGVLRNLNSALSQFFNVDYSKVEPARTALVAAKKAVKLLQDELNSNAVSSFLSWLTGGILGTGAVVQANTAVQGLKDYQKKIDDTVKQADDETKKLLGQKDDLQKQVDEKNKEPKDAPAPVVIPGTDIIGGGFNDKTQTRDALKTLNSVLRGPSSNDSLSLLSNQTFTVDHNVTIDYKPQPIRASYDFTADSNVQGSDIDPKTISDMVSKQLTEQVNDQLMSAISSRQVVQSLSRQLNQTR